MPMLARHRQVGSCSPASLNGCPERFEQPLGDQLGAGGQRQLLGEYDELVAAEAPEGVGVAHDAVEPRGDRPEQLIAGARDRACR